MCLDMHAIRPPHKYEMTSAAVHLVPGFRLALSTCQSAGAFARLTRSTSAAGVAFFSPCALSQHHYSYAHLWIAAIDLLLE